MARKKNTDELLAFFVRRDTTCGECSCELPHGSMITLQKEKGALCLSCADLDHLDYLSRGDAALTRRSRKYSRLSAVVLEWSRTRKRYERQGILAEPKAIEQAETECLNDAEQRARRREREQVKRQEIDGQYVSDFAGQIAQLYPGCPAASAEEIATHACRRYSGRVGRSAAAKCFDPEAIALAVGAWVRHNCTNYDDLLAGMVDRHEARRMIRGDLAQTLRQWSAQEA